MGLFDIAVASSKSDAERGVERVLGKGVGAARESLKPSPCSLSTRLFIRFPQTTPIVGTLNVGSPEHQIVGVLIVRFLEHQQHNRNLDDLTSWASAA